jgi:NADPH-dependent 2,4-dienoyl-CoA reductase/sulfur reductase-like enzyme
MPARHALLPRTRDLGAEWLLGVTADGLDAAGHRVLLSDGRRIDFDKVLICTGTRTRPWPNREEGALDGVFVVRGLDDAELLRARLAADPRRVLVIGGGFTGSEIASVCRELGLAVTPR